MTSFCESFARLHLYTLLTLADIVEAWERAIYVSIYLFPRLAVEDRIALGNFTDDDPVCKLTDFLVWLVSVLRHGGHGFIPDGAHVVVVTVVDVGLVLRA